MNVLVFAAHPDDEVLGMGGVSIALHADRGDAVTVVCLTDGSLAQYAGDDATRAQKNDEAQAAAKVLGVAEYLHLDLPDMRLDTLAHVDVNRVVEEHLRERQAEGRLHRASRREPRPPHAFRLGCGRHAPDAGPTGAPPPHYAPTSSTEWTPRRDELVQPNWFVDISSTFQRKLDAFACFKTEERPAPHPRNARARGACPAARRHRRLRVRRAVRARSVGSGQ